MIPPLLGRAVALTAPLLLSLPSKAPGQEEIETLLAQFASEAKTDLPILGEGVARELRQRWAQADQEPTTLEGESRLLQVTMDLSRSEMRLGNLDKGIQLAESAYQRLLQAQRVYQLPDHGPAKVAYDLGVAYLRRAESRNCCAQNGPENCILPLQGSGIHEHPEDAKKAISYFTEVLEKAPPNTTYALRSRWLLNVMFMATGGYPNQVPKAYLIPPAVFESEEDFPRFRNIAPEVGVDVFDLLGGTVIDDFTGDGYLDIVVSTWNPAEPIRIFRNEQDGSFAERTVEAKLGGSVGGCNLVQADYDNDGDLDLFVLRGGWLGPHGKVPNSLLQNDGTGTFVDVTIGAGLGELHYPSQTASWGDYDRDGHLDLYVGNENQPEGEPAPCQLFRNNGDGTFTDVAEAAGVRNLRFAKAVVWGDHDADGFADLYVSNYGGANRLYRNNQDGTFTDVAERLGVAEPVSSFPAWFWDFNNDGNLDLLVSAYDLSGGSMPAFVANRLGLPANYEVPRLYRADGKGGFEDVARAQNLNRVSLPMGANFGDLDNDGFLEFYLGTGYPDYESLMPSVMYRNRGGKGFSDITTAGGFGHLQKGHGIAFADLDNDGDQDVYGQMGGFYHGDRAFNTLFENPGFGSRWIAIKLVGIRSNRSAIGARIHVQVEEGGTLRSIYRHVNSGGSFGANPLRQTIGLGKASRIVRIEIQWPSTGEEQVLEDLPMDQFIKITEGVEEPQTLSLKKLNLGAAAE